MHKTIIVHRDISGGGGGEDPHFFVQKSAGNNIIINLSAATIVDKVLEFQNKNTFGEK